MCEVKQQQQIVNSVTNFKHNPAFQSNNNMTKMPWSDVNNKGTIGKKKHKRQSVNHTLEIWNTVYFCQHFITIHLSILRDINDKSQESYQIYIWPNGVKGFKIDSNTKNIRNNYPKTCKMK